MGNVGSDFASGLLSTALVVSVTLDASVVLEGSVTVVATDALEGSGTVLTSNALEGSATVVASVTLVLSGLEAAVSISAALTVFIPMVKKAMMYVRTTK